MRNSIEIETCLRLLDSGKWEDRVKLFESAVFSKYLQVSYSEYLELFGDGIDKTNEALVKLNKMVIYTHMDYYNFVQNQSWQYKWYPLLFKFALNTVQLRPTSILFSLVYLASVDKLLERWFMFHYMDKKVINVGNLFLMPLSKERNKQQIESYYEQYRELIRKELLLNSNSSNSSSNSSNTIIVMGQRFSIYNPYFEWDQQYQQDDGNRMRQLFIENNQLALLSERLLGLGRWMSNIGDDAGRSMMMEDVKQVAEDCYEQARQEIMEFGRYKTYLDVLPTRSKIDNMLGYDKIDQRKRYLLRDELKLIPSKIINNFRYFVNGRTDFIRHEFKIFESSVLEKKPSLKVESYYYDLLTFTIICLLPAKLINIRKTITNLKRNKTLAFYQAQSQS